MFDGYEGFVPSILYPGFSADFFDKLHNVTVRGINVFFLTMCAHGVGAKIGGGYATPPRQAERRTVRNWFQRNYPYAWNGGRVAYDVAK